MGLGRNTDELLTAVIGPAMIRLSMTFDDAAAHQKFLAGKPAIAEVLAIGDPAAHDLTVPTTLLWAPRGLVNQTPGLLTAEAIEAANLGVNVTVTQVPDCNHYSIMFADHALAAITAAIGSTSI